ncbi:reticulophagy regulator 2-like [Brienomyrus brachyistius]|uniref:reticulophagy regulator 2-like n=1 Tax=Brienomyrus brachyistius TaxID=42636 RepID=UPI0020B21ACB|nr:reticulophagy regulator 2-like [Brienomyrus brachyistius]
MASEEEVSCAPVSSSSSLRLEALFPAVGTEQASGEGNPELVRLRERLQGWLSPYEAVLLWAQRLLVWERPLHSVCAAFTLNTVFWLLSSSFLRPLFLLSVFLLGILLLERWKGKLPRINVQHPEASVTERETVSVHPRLLSIPELSHHLAESYITCSLYIQEMLQYKRLNHGRFCMLMCAGCMVLAVVGHYIPGIMISYIILISVLLWPLVVYHELIQKMYTGLEPILMKLDYSMKGGTQHRKHDKKKTKKETEEGDEPQAETESESEEELPCFAPTVDVKTTALAMAITDSELSDEEASILESGGFSVSRATTPQLTDVSEDLDQQSITSEAEEAFSRDLPEFPSVDEFSSIEHGLPQVFAPLPGCGLGFTMDTQEGEPQSPASLLFQHLASPLHFVNTHFNGHGKLVRGSQGGAEGMKEAPQGASLSLEALSEEIVSTAISTVVQNTLTAMLHSSEAREDPSIDEFLPAETAALQSTLFSETDLNDGSTATATTDTAENPIEPHTLTEEEDFELLDQSELEQMDEELGLISENQAATVAGSTPPDLSHQTQQS